MSKLFTSPLLKGEDGSLITLHRLSVGVCYTLSKQTTGTTEKNTIYHVLNAPDFSNEISHWGDRHIASFGNDLLYLVLDTTKYIPFFVDPDIKVYLANPPEGKGILMKILPFTFMNQSK